MSEFHTTTVQVVLLCGADSWAVTDRDLNKLRAFHKRAVRHMCGSHIRRGEDGVWECPDHDLLSQKCGLNPIEVHLERRRCTLRRHLEANGKDLLLEAKNCGRHCRDVNKVLWWDQSYHESSLQSQSFTGWKLNMD